MDKDLFLKEIEKLNIKLTNEQINQLDMYYELLLEWNKKINLTRIIEKKDVYLKHFYDSLTLVKVIDFNKNISICDVGTGAGFPGIVLKIAFSNIKLTLIDSLNKRIIFLNDVIEKLNLNDVEAVHTRMEDYSVNNKEKFDYITSRAVADASIITEISIQSLKVNGSFLLMKGSCKEELFKLKENLTKFGCIIESVTEFNLPIENSNRVLIKIKKIEKTNNKYPRDISKIKKTL